MIKSGLNQKYLTPEQANFFFLKQNVPEGIMKHTLKHYKTPENQVKDYKKNEGKNGQLGGGFLK